LTAGISAGEPYAPLHREAEEAWGAGPPASCRGLAIAPTSETLLKREKKYLLKSKLGHNSFLYWGRVKGKIDMLSLLSRLIPDLSQTIARFPVAVLVSLFLFVYANLDVSGYISDGFKSENPVYLAGAAAFMAAGALHYFALGRGLSRGVEFIL